jgi:hypothetical protein
MKKYIIMGIGILVAIAAIGAAVIFGVPYIKSLLEPKPAPQETDVSLGGERGLDIPPDATEGIGTDTDLLPDEQPTESPVEEATGSEDIPLDTEPSPGEGGIEPDDLLGDASEVAGTGELSGIDVTPAPRETRIPEEGSERPGERLSETTTPTSEEGGSPTPIPTTPVVNATPKPTPGPAPGNYSVQTIEPVFKSQLAAVRKAMNSLGVTLKERKTEHQYLSAYRIAIGYFLGLL